MILGMIGTTELIVIGGAILLLFGGKKIPGLMKSMGQGVKSFKQGLREDLPEDDEDKADGTPEESSNTSTPSATEASDPESAKDVTDTDVKPSDDHGQKD